MREVYCNECNTDFAIVPKKKKHGQGIQETYFTCPECSFHYTAFITDANVRKIQREVRQLMGPDKQQIGKSYKHETISEEAYEVMFKKLEDKIKLKQLEIIGGRRYCGKTTELIQRAHKEQLYILCASTDMAMFIARQANEMGLNIPHPITVDELRSSNTNVKDVLVDEVEKVLQQLIGKRVAGMSTSYEMKELPSLKGPNNIDTDLVSQVGTRIKGYGELEECKVSDAKPERIKSSSSLLTIELQDESSVPKVTYKGEELEALRNVALEWVTDTDVMGECHILVEHFSKVKGKPISNKIEHAIGQRALDHE